MRAQTLFALSTGIAALAFATPAAAQSDDKPFEGVYVGATLGFDMQPNDVGEAISFDRGLDGTFGDTLTTVGGADAFSTGFCNGQARAATRNPGCRNDSDSAGYTGRIGYDRQYGHMVVGIVAEFGDSQIRDSVTAFSITPASYTMNREINFTAGIRGRLGYAANKTLFYGTGGGAYARVNNYFRTTNVVNGFTANGDSNAFGFAAGGGIEQKVSKNVSIGLEFLHTQLQDDDYRVRVTGGPATSPFTIGGGGGTDFRRSFEKFRYQSLRATVAYRF